MTISKKLRDMELPPGYNACLLLDAAAEIDRLTRERNEARAECDAMAKDAEQMRAELNTIARTPAMPFPDPGAHSERAYHEAVFVAWSRSNQTARAALAQIEQERSEQTKEG